VTRVALTGTIGAAVLVVALGLFFAIYQDESGDIAPPAGDTAAPGSSSSATGDQEAATGGKAGEAGQSAAGTAGGQAAGQPQTGEAAKDKPVPPSFDVVRVNPSGDAVIAGRAEPNAEITILDKGKIIGSVQADQRGEWVFLPDSALDPGEHSFTLESTPDPDDVPKAEATKRESETSVVVLVPQVAKDIAGRNSNQPAGALAMEVPKSGTGPTRVMNVPNQPAEASAGAPEVPEISAIDYDSSGRAILSGRAPGGARLFVYLDNQSMGETLANEDGFWSFTPNAPIAPGLHVIRVDQVDQTGKVLARAQIPFEQAELPLASQAGSGDQPTGSVDGTQSVDGMTVSNDRIVVQPGNSLWRIARESYGEGVRYTVIYEANREQIANPDLIYPGQVFKIPND
jgi:nucleoid-associated protein YgaU